MKIQEHNVETGEVVIRDMTEEELAVYKAGQVSVEQFEIEKDQKKTKKEALMARLGIDEEDLKALGLA